MNIQDATLTIFYFFDEKAMNRSHMEVQASRAWADRLIGRFGLVQRAAGTEVYDDRGGQCYLDLEYAHGVTLVRLSLTHPGAGGMEQWRKIRGRVHIDHEQLLREAGRQGFLGCSLVYWGLAGDADKPLPSEWLPHVPVEATEAAPHAVRVPAGTLWQIQASWPAGHYETVWALVAAPEREKDINYGLIYQPAFWQSEAIRHQAYDAIRRWLADGQPRLRRSLRQMAPYLEVSRGARGVWSLRHHVTLHDACDSLFRQAGELIAVEERLQQFQFRYHERFSALTSEYSARMQSGRFSAELEPVLVALDSESKRIQWTQERMQHQWQRAVSDWALDSCRRLTVTLSALGMAMVCGAMWVLRHVRRHTNTLSCAAI